MFGFHGNIIEKMDTLTQTSIFLFFEKNKYVFLFLMKGSILKFLKKNHEMSLQLYFHLKDKHCN